MTQPLLSISIPTYNRAACLKRLLTLLHEQSGNDPRVEIIVSDNASTDNTRHVVEDFLRCGMTLRYVRNEVNLGGEENMRRCYTMCTGRYAWVFGDDDVVAPGAMQKILHLLDSGEYDLIFLAPYHFRGYSDNFLPSRTLWPDAFNVTSDPGRLVDLVDTHSDMIFITSVIINKELARRFMSSEPTRCIDDTIIQFSWLLPLLKNMRRAVYVQAQWIGQATENQQGGYDAAYFFGTRFMNAVNAWLEPDSSLARRMINNHLTMWGGNWLDWKWNRAKLSRGKQIDLVSPHEQLKPLYGSNLRYWLCVYPLIVLPRPLAKVWDSPWLARRILLRMWYQAVTPRARRAGNR